MMDDGTNTTYMRHSIDNLLKVEKVKVKVQLNGSYLLKKKGKQMTGRVRNCSGPRSSMITQVCSHGVSERSMNVMLS